MSKATKATMLVERQVAVCEACNARRSPAMMDLHLEMNEGEGLHVKTTGYTITVSRYSQFADMPIGPNDTIIEGAHHAGF